jgi:hypothetical protein
MNKIKIISISLGIISLSFGLLKFVNPFKDWYRVQIETSGFPASAYTLGIIGEIIIGLLFLLPFIISLDHKQKRLLLILANASLILMMLVAAVIHLISEVPANVLPLKIKPPIIPLMFLVIAIINLINILRKIK